MKTTKASKLKINLFFGFEVLLKSKSIFTHKKKIAHSMSCYKFYSLYKWITFITKFRF